MRKEKVEEFERRGKSTDLAVLLHAYRLDPTSLTHIRAIVAEKYPDADIFAPGLPFSTFSSAQPSVEIAKLLMRIDQAWGERLRDDPKGYQRILFIGHSMGALFLRKLYVCACGENPEAPFERELKGYLKGHGGEPLDAPRPWVDRVERIVLLAGMNRGWSISHHLSVKNAILWTIGVAAGNFRWGMFGRPPVIFSIRRGASFLTQLRIQWLAMRRAASTKKVGSAITIQLLGTIDDMVSPEDDVDLVAGKDFVYLDIPRSDHPNVIVMDGSQAGKGRREVFVKAITLCGEPLEAEQILPADFSLTERPDVTDVVFVIHGIRDKGYWTQKIARHIIAMGRRNGRIIASKTSTYGYFPMLSFLLPSKRRAKVEWLMDQYAEALALYPNAKRFSYVGHSNGTYLLARALEEYPSCRFDRVVFAGSVVRREYDWSRFVPAQVQAVLNYVATADWVVAFFPKALQTLRLQDLGSAGHDGFTRLSSGSHVFQPKHYVVGHHAAALQEAMWDAIARFIVLGEVKPPPGVLQSRKQAWWVKYPGKVPVLVWVGILAILCAIGYGLIKLPLYQWQSTLLLVLYIGGIWKVLTKV